MPSKAPNALVSILKMKCPRCRRGNMFTNNNPWKLKETFSMHNECPICGQKTELEVGFYYGTGYVSYALTVAISVATFVAWFVLIGMSIHDSRFFYWLGCNMVFLMLMQPWVSRLSRVIYLWIFVKYDPEAAEKHLLKDVEPGKD